MHVGPADPTARHLEPHLPGAWHRLRAVEDLELRVLADHGSHRGSPAGDLGTRRPVKASHRVAVVYGFGVLLLAGEFLFWHSGGRAERLCLRARFVSSGSLSWWPPGTRCEFGLPVMSDTVLNFWFVPTAFITGILITVLVSVADRR